MTVPIVGGAGTSLSVPPLPAIAASAMTTREATKSETAYCFFIRTPYQTVELKSEIISQNLDVASGRVVCTRRTDQMVFSRVPDRKTISVSVVVTAADSRQYWQKW